MSSRAIRRLERKKLLDLGSPPKKVLDSEEEEGGDEDEEIVKDQPVKSFNAFAFLGNDDDEDGDEDRTEEEKDNEDEEIKKENIVKIAAAPGKSKKNKKKTKKAQNVELNDDELDKFLEQVKQKDKKLMSQSNSRDITPIGEDLLEEEDLEWEFDQEDQIDDFDSNFKFFTTSRLKESLSILSIETIKHLDADNEFQNLFGKLSIDTIEDANTTTSLAISPDVLQQFKRLARLTRGWSGKDRRGVPGTTRKLLFTKIRDDWLPTAQKPLNMDEIEGDNLIEYFLYKEDDPLLGYEFFQNKLSHEKKLGVKYFKFQKLAIPTVQERLATTQFYASVVITPDPESLIQLVQKNPYHAETLLQVAMVLLRQGSDKSTSNALVEKCLFMFDRCLHKNFHELLLQGSNGLIRLPFESFMNRQFQLCLFRYIMILGERSTYFTALNYCKLLLSFLPADDPLGVRYFIDYYAIMSDEYKWLVDFVQSPMCTTYKRWLTPGLAFSVALAHLRLGNEDELKKSLKLAFKRHTYTAAKLLETVGLSTYIPEILNDIPSDEVLIGTETYMVRAAVLWKDQKEKEFLHDELTKLFQESNDIEKPKKSFLSSLWGSGKNDGGVNASIPFNLLRFAILSGENKIMAKIPENVWARDDVFEYDILPPKDETVVYNEYTGIGSGGKGKVVDKLLDYVDGRVLEAIVRRTSSQDADDFDALLGQLQEEGN